MAQIIIQFPDGIGSRVNDLLGRRWQYQDTIPDPADPESTIPNPESKVDFNKKQIVVWVKSRAVEQEITEAGQTAATAQRSISESELDITTP